MKSLRLLGLLPLAFGAAGSARAVPLAAALAQTSATTAPEPVRFGANVPQVNRYSPEKDWGAAGGLVAWALQGRAARISATSWAMWPEGFRGGQVDLGQISRQMEVLKGASRVLVVLMPSEWPISGAWVPPKESWPAALEATKRMVAEYDAGAKRAGLPPPDYQIWNETSPGKPGGGKSGAPGAFDPALHEYLAYLLKGLVPTTSTALRKRMLTPAYSDLTDAPDAATRSLATGASETGVWENRCGVIAAHFRLKGVKPDGAPMTPEELEASVPGQVERIVKLLRALPWWRGENLPVDATEVYLTPGDLGRPALNQGDLGAWRLAALRGLAKSDLRTAYIYGLPLDVKEGGGKWGEYGGWAPSLAESKIETFAKTARPK